MHACCTCQHDKARCQCLFDTSYLSRWNFAGNYQERRPHERQGNVLVFQFEWGNEARRENKKLDNDQSAMWKT